MKKLVSLGVILFLLPMTFAELNICNIDLGFDSNTNWLKIEYDEEGRYDIKVYNQSNTSQLIGTAEIEIDHCPIIPLCGETLTLEANSTHKIDTVYCDIEINTRGSRTEFLNTIASERNNLKTSLSDCIKRNFTCSLPKPSDCICEVDCALEKEEDLTSNEESFFEEYKTTIMIFGLLIFFIIVLVVVVMVLRKTKPTKSKEPDYYPERGNYPMTPPKSEEVELPRRDVTPKERFQRPQETTRKKGPDFSFLKGDRK